MSNANSVMRFALDHADIASAALDGKTIQFKTLKDEWRNIELERLFAILPRLAHKGFRIRPEPCFQLRLDLTKAQAAALLAAINQPLVDNMIHSACHEYSMGDLRSAASMLYWHTDEDSRVEDTQPKKLPLHEKLARFITSKED